MNKTIRALLLMTICLWGAPGAFAQSSSDALRYSLFESFGTARSAGTAGSLGALGADFSVISSNPAGLGWYRRSEFSISPLLTTTNVTSQLENGTGNIPRKETESKFNLANFGVVVASRPRNIRWSNVNFGIGFNRLADFNRSTFLLGTSNGTIVDRFVERANRDGLDDFEAGLAVDAEALLFDSNNEEYFSDFEAAPTGYQIEREQTITTGGGINELVFSLAGNYQERLLVGATIGVPFLSYTERKSYRERDPSDDVPFFDALEFRENLTTTGAGLNLKLGLIYRINQMARIGAAIHTPTVLTLEDNYSTSLTYDYTDNGQARTGSANSPDGLYNYKLRTPWRLLGNAGFLFGKNGFLSVEVEYVDYGSAELRFENDDAYQAEVNAEIATNLRPALNARVGGELAYDSFRFRGGVNLRQSPVEGDDELDSDFTLGLGLREQSFFLDLAYRLTMTKEGYVPYQTDTGPLQFFNNDITNNRFILTLGFRF